MHVTTTGTATPLFIFLLPASDLLPCMIYLHKYGGPGQMVFFGITFTCMKMFVFRTKFRGRFSVQAKLPTNWQWRIATLYRKGDGILCKSDDIPTHWRIYAPASWNTQSRLYIQVKWQILIMKTRVHWSLNALFFLLSFSQRIPVQITQWYCKTRLIHISSVVLRLIKAR